MYAALSALRINLYTCTRAVGPGYYIQRLRRSSTTYAISSSREVRYVVTVNKATNISSPTAPKALDVIARPNGPGGRRGLETER